MKFIESLPENTNRNANVRVDELRARPGQWAEIGRYAKSSSSPFSRGFQYTKRHPDIEYAVRTIDNERVLFMRAVEL